MTVITPYNQDHSDLQGAIKAAVAVIEVDITEAGTVGLLARSTRSLAAFPA